MTDDESKLLSRAMAAHYAAYGREGGTVEDPSEDSSGVEHVGGKAYVILRNVRGILRVYRVRSDGVLKGLRRWPKELDS